MCRTNWGPVPWHRTVEQWDTWVDTYPPCPYVTFTYYCSKFEYLIMAKNTLLIYQFTLLRWVSTTGMPRQSILLLLLDLKPLFLCQEAGCGLPFCISQLAPPHVWTRRIAFWSVPERWGLLCCTEYVIPCNISVRTFPFRFWAAGCWVSQWFGACYTRSE